MPLTLPRLDDVTWSELNEEARALIPGIAPGWTNFNASDPGITILELLAHFSEILLFRADAITDAQVEYFLRLLNGPSWHPRLSLAEERQRTLTSLAETQRAVTARDFELLAINGIGLSQHQIPIQHRVARARCIVNRNLEGSENSNDDMDAPGHMSIVIVTQQDPVPAASTLRRVRKSLQEARLITTRVHVIGPRFVRFRVRLTFHIASEASQDWITTDVLNQLQDFFNPLRGGADEQGWPFGKFLFISELYLLLSKVPGVEYITPTASSEEDGNDEILLDPAERWRKQYNARNELESVELRPHELPRLEIAPEDLVIRRRRGAR